MNTNAKIPQHTSEPNPATCKKDYTLWLWLISGMQGWFSIWKSIPIINKGQKSHDHLNRHRKSTEQNLTLLHDKNNQQTTNRRELPQLDTAKKILLRLMKMKIQYNHS